MKILTFTSLYPNPEKPQHGIFTQTSMRHLAKTKRVEFRVIAPIPWFPSRHPVFGRYARMARCCIAREEEGMHISHPRFPVLPKVGQTLAPFLMAAAMIPVLRKMLRAGEEFDVIDAHYFYPDGVAAVLLGLWFDKPVVVKALGSDINVLGRGGMSKMAIVWAARRAAKISTVSAALKERLVEMGVSPEKITVIRNGVDLALFEPSGRDDIRETLGLQGFTLLSVGNLVASKGHHLAIEMLLQAPDVTLVIAGDGPERAALNELAARLRVHDRVRFLGSVKQAVLVDYYKAADAMVLASQREGWANVLLESMACGTPVVASDIAGTREVVCTDAAGVLFGELSAGGLAAAVRSIRANYPSRDATRRYAEQFCWNAPTQGQIRLYEQMIYDGRAEPDSPGLTTLHGEDEVQNATFRDNKCFPESKSTNSSFNTIPKVTSI